MFSNYSSTSWAKSNISSINIPDRNTIYLRSTTMIPVGDYSAFYTKISHISGVVVYINGEEIYRKFVSESSTSSDYATGVYEYLTDIKYVLSSTRIENDITLIAIELHKHMSETSFPNFNFYLLPFSGDSSNGCTTVNTYITFPINEYSSQFQTSSVYVVDFGFDNVYDQIWEQSWDNSHNPSSFATARMYENTFVQFNYFGICVANSSTEYQPKKVKLSALNQDNRWDIIGEYDNIEYPISDGKNIASYILYNETKPRSAFQVEVLEKYNGNKLYIRDFLLYLCPIRKCSASSVVGLPEDYSGSIITISCESSAHYRTFECPNERNAIWTQIESNCISDTPKVIYQETTYHIVQGEKYSKLVLATFTGANLIYGMTPSISGLTIDPSTGIISGAATQANGLVLLTITARNSNLLSTSAVIQLTIEATTLPVVIDADDLNLLAGDSVTKVLFQLIAADSFTYSDFPRGLTFDSNTFTLTGIALISGEYQIVFKASNNYGSLDFVINIVINDPDNPKIVIKDNLDIFYGETYENVLYPIICVGKGITYSTNEVLPESLNYNTTTGELYGKVSILPTAGRSYTFTCRNTANSLSDSIIITVTYSDYPIIISFEESLDLTAGNEYKDYEFFEATGNNVVYTVNPQLPDNLQIDSTTGKLSGYITKSLSRTFTLIASSSNKTALFEFKIIGKVSPLPSYIKSSLQTNYTFNLGIATETTSLFVPVGDNIIVTITPDLPSGFFINSATGAIYGTAAEDTEGKEYTFRITNNNGFTELKIFINYIAIYCLEDNGFSKTLAIETIGKTVSIKCASGQSGSKNRICYLKDRKGEWSEIEDTCSLATGAITGIIIGCVLLLLVIICIIIYCILRCGCCRKRASSVKEQKQKTKIPDSAAVKV